ncbi:MAG: PP2C family protein-serine/threonine phosphatase [Thiolinea sp.]
MNSLLRRVVYHLFPPTWQCKARSHIGPRSENQDNYLQIYPDGRVYYQQASEHTRKDDLAGWSKDFYRIAVADGMGGHLHGREVAEDLMLAVMELPAQTNFDPLLLRDSLSAIHKQLMDKYHPVASSRQPGSTLVMADVHRMTGQVLLAHVGDSRAYVWRKGQSAPEMLTWDHSNSEFDWRDAVKEDANTPLPTTEKSHAVAQAMGFGSYGLVIRDGYRPRQLSASLRLDVEADLPHAAHKHADICSFFLQKGDTLILATDGLWSAEGFIWPEPPHKSDTLPAYIEELIDKAVIAGCTDNVTVAALGCY